MEKQLLKEELSRIWEIMGVKGDKTLLRESIIDDLVQMIIKKGAGEADVAVQLAKIQADFPYLKGLTKTDLGKLAKGGVDAAPVIQKIVGKMSGDQLTSLANDIYKNSVDIQDLIKNQMDGITANIKSGSLDVAGAQRYISDNVNDWIKPVGGSADNLVAKLRTRLMDELGGQVQDVAAGVSKVATEVQDDISKLFDDITSTGDDIGATIPKIESELSKQIKSSKQFQDLKLPSNITPDDLATEVSSSIAAKLNKQADMVDPKVWDSLPPTAQMKYLQDALSNLKAVNPTYYNKVLKKIQDFFTTNPNKKLKWSRAKQIWILGMIPVAAYQIKDVVDTVKMDGSASDIGVGIADAVLKTTLWPASLLTMPFGGIDLDGDYVNSLKSFEQYVIDELGIPAENADQRVDEDETEKGIYYVSVKNRQTGEMDEVQYRYNSSLGTFVKSTTPNPNPTPTPTPNPNPNPTMGTLTTAAQVQSSVQSVPGYSGVTVSSFTFLDKNGDIETYKITDPNGASGTLNYNTTTRTATIS